MAEAMEERPRSRSPPGLAADVAADSPVPIIDISALNSGDMTARKDVADKIGRACEDIGFFIVVNHGIPVSAVDAVWQKTTEFFDLPLDEKRKLITEDEAVYPYGYSAFGAELLAQGKTLEKHEGDSNSQVVSAAGDVKEMFNIGPNDPSSGMPARRPAGKPEGFDGAWEEYFEEANKLAGRLLGAFALALDLPEDWFAKLCDRHISALRANNYPNQTGLAVAPGSIRCSAHTDYGTLTILRSGGPGLQVSKDRDDPIWRSVPHVENSFVVNLGDLMRRWTNDRWSSTLHRVVNPPANQVSAWGRRLSLAFFHNLNKDAVVKAIPSCVSESHPALHEPIVAGDFLMLKHLASNRRPAKGEETAAVGGS